MRSKRTEQFNEMFKKLPMEIQKLAHENYRLWHDNPKHPSLHFKIVYPKRLNIWSVRIGENYRAMALVEDNTAKWFWIDAHKNYERILKNLKAAAISASTKRN